MAYESRLYIVQKHTNQERKSDGKVWGEIIAVFNLCVANLDLRKYPYTNCYIHTFGEDSTIEEDDYGKPLKEIPIKDMIEYIEEIQKIEDGGYRRWRPCLQLLKGFDESQWNELVVLHYGY